MDTIDGGGMSISPDRIVAVPAVCRFIAVAMLVMFAGVAPASAWWQYAEWGFSEAQILTASNGQAVPCRPDAPVCTATPNARRPTLFVQSTRMLGMPASVSFSFDAARGLSETVVEFSNADFALISNLLQGIHGQPIEDRASAPPVRVWQDRRRGSTIAATPVGTGIRLDYLPANRSR